MTAVLVAVGDAIAAEINAYDFTTDFDFEAERSWADFDVTLEDREKGLRVDVVPVGHESAEQVDRAGTVDYRPLVDVGLRYKFPPEDTKESDGRIDPQRIDALVSLYEQMIEMLEHPNHYRLSAYTAAAFSALTIRTVCPRNFIRDHRQFLAIFRLTYQVYKQP